MFGNSYFGVRYWGDRYWGGGAQAVQPQLGGTSGRRRGRRDPSYRIAREKDFLPPVPPPLEIPVHLLEQLIEQQQNRIAREAQNEEDAILLLLLAA